MCNQGLNTILSISVPVLNMVYPVAIVLIVMGLAHKHLDRNALAFPLTVGAVSVVSVVYALDQLKVPLGVVSDLFRLLPFYDYGMGWVTVAVAMVLVSVVVQKVVHPAPQLTQEPTV